jgi:hypothetical protein
MVTAILTDTAHLQIMQSFEPKLDGLAVSEEDAKMLVEHLSKVIKTK